MALKIVATAIYGLLALILGVAVIYKACKGEKDMQSALWFSFFLVGIAAIWV